MFPGVPSGDRGNWADKNRCVTEATHVCEESLGKINAAQSFSGMCWSTNSIA